MKTKVEIEVDIPDGYEATGEWRCPLKNEEYLCSSGKVETATWDFNNCRHIILRKVEKWVPIDLSKVTLDMLPMRARFRDLPNEKWNACGLAAFTTERADRFCDETGTYWGYCEVLEEAK